MNGSDIRSSLSLTKASYLDFLILLGTDFSRRIKNVGPARAYSFVRKYGNIENILASEAKYPPRDGVEKYMDQVNAARQVFTNLPPVPSKNDLVQRQEDSEKVKQILTRYGIWKTVSSDSGFGTTLNGGYFGDNPEMT
jgi:flap endonuclease-1